MESQVDKGRRFRQLVGDIAQELSAEILPANGDNDTYQTLRAPGGPVFGLYLGGWGDRAKRLEISLATLRYNDARGDSQMVTASHVVGYGNTPPSITVSFDRPAKAIAADIARRFLPGATEVYQKMVDRVGSSLAYEDKTKAALAKLASAAGATVRPGSTMVSLDEDAGYARLTPQGESVRFEAFSVPTDVALKIVAILKGGA